MFRSLSPLLLLGAAGLLGCCLADIPGDVITSLPGWRGPLPTKQYSGYIDISDTKHMHYWFVQSGSKPESDPVVLWLVSSACMHSCICIIKLQSTATYWLHNIQ